MVVAGGGRNDFVVQSNLKYGEVSRGVFRGGARGARAPPSASSPVLINTWDHRINCWLVQWLFYLSTSFLIQLVLATC